MRPYRRIGARIRVLTSKLGRRASMRSATARPAALKCVAGYAFLPMRLVSGPANDGPRPKEPGQEATAGGAGPVRKKKGNGHGNRQRTGRAVGPGGA